MRLLIFSDIHSDAAALGKLMAFARNDRLFTDGSDEAQLAREIRYVLSGTEDVAKALRVGDAETLRARLLERAGRLELLWSAGSWTSPV